jgi:5-methylcytosine-specific restriction endonuclease McrA
MSKTHKNRAVRIQTYSVDEIFDFLRNNPFQIDPSVPKWRAPKKQYYIDSNGNKMSVRRARVFLEKGVRCQCGLCGSFFALEKWNDGGLHLDLYAKDKVGDDVLMTIDHINPKSNGGPDEIENYATMCKVCNEDKADIVIVV